MAQYQLALFAACLMGAFSLRINTISDTKWTSDDQQITDQDWQFTEYSEKDYQVSDQERIMFEKALNGTIGMHVYLHDQWSKCESNRKALVFNMDKNGPRWKWMQKHLTSLGLCPARYPACDMTNIQKLKAPKGEVWKCRNKDTVGTFAYKPSSYLYNGLTQISAWRDMMRHVSEGEWMFFFEDDATLNPGFEKSHGENFQEILNGALSISKEAGDHYLSFGMCSPKCEEKPTKMPEVEANVQYARCGGACAHAYGMDFRAMELLTTRVNNLIEKVRPTETTPEGVSLTKEDANAPCPEFVSCIHDPFGAHEMLHQGCKPKSEVCGNLYGLNYGSRCAKDHKGLFFQDRSRFNQSDITGAITCGSLPKKKVR